MHSWRLYSILLSVQSGLNEMQENKGPEKHCLLCPVWGPCKTGKRFPGASVYLHKFHISLILSDNCAPNFGSIALPTLWITDRERLDLRTPIIWSFVARTWMNGREVAWEVVYHAAHWTQTSHTQQNLPQVVSLKISVRQCSRRRILKIALRLHRLLSQWDLWNRCAFCIESSLQIA